MNKIYFNNRSFRNVLLNLFALLFGPFVWAQTPIPFDCSGLAYQVTSSGGGTNSNFYSYNVVTGSRTLISGLSLNANAVGYNTVDNFIWGMRGGSTQLVKIGSNGAVQTFNIPNLPAPVNDYNVGDFIGNGYLFIYENSAARYYVIDVNPARSTYLQMVDPTASFVLDAAPYGNTFNGSPGLAISDLAYNPATGLLYGLMNPDAARRFEWITINPITRAVTFSVTQVSGAGIQGESFGYGAILIDQNSGGFYAFANDQGRFYRVNTATNTATLLSTAIPAQNTDGTSCPAANLIQPTPFSCSNLAYQVAGSTVGNSSLYSYNVTTGSQTLLGQLSVRANAIGYNKTDNFIWGVNVANNQVVKIGSNTVLESFTIPNLPPADLEIAHNVGDIIGDGYLFIYRRTSASYYVVDINPARSTYLQLVDPTASYGLDTAPFGNTFAGGVAGLSVSDLVYNSSDGLLYGLVDPTGGNAFEIVTLNPVTRAVTYSGSKVSGAGIQGEAEAFGSVFIDQTANTFYVFANQLGRFYRVNLATKTASLVSNSVPAFSNDGASCPTSILATYISGTVFHDPDGGNVNNSSGGANTVPAGLFANLVGTDGNVAAVVGVSANGTYEFNNAAPGAYTVVLSTTSGTIGSAAPSPALPGTWLNTGEFNGPENTGTSTPVDGISQQFTLTTTIANINFGIQQPPVADPKQYLVDNAAFSAIPPAGGYTAEAGYKSIPASSTMLTGSPAYPTLGSLSGSDPEDCAAAGTCNTGTGTTFNIVTINPNTILKYDFGPSGGIQTIDVSTNPVTIQNFDVTKLVIYGANGAGTTGNALGFTYSITDKAGATSAPVIYTIQTPDPLPVTLIRFDVYKEGQTSNLKWATSTEQNSKGFEIQRSTDAKSWKNIGFVHAKSLNGNSKSTLHYDFSDKAPAKGTNYYRLKMVDLDETFAFSSVKVISIEHAAPIISAYPNPVQDELIIEGLRGAETIKVLNSSGRIMLQSKNKADQSKKTLDLRALANGMYLISIQSPDGSLVSHKIIKGR